MCGLATFARQRLEATTRIFIEMSKMYTHMYTSPTMRRYFKASILQAALLDYIA